MSSENTLFPLPDTLLRPMVEQALSEDLGRRGDITSAAVIAPDKTAKLFLVSRLRIWANSADTEEVRQKRLKRIHLCWGVEPENWSEEYVLQRYEMLYESGLIAEAAEPQANFDFALTGQPMRHDHRRVLATALSRLRAKIKYRPVIFELMPPEFTLLQLQNSVEAISGRLLHKQNFRRQIQQQNLIEPSDTGVSGSKGRPAQLYRFRDDVLPDRLISDIGLPLGSR